MKAHIVTHNLFPHTFDHAANGNTLIFIQKYFFSFTLVTFLIIIGRVPAISKNRNLLDWGFLIFTVNYPYL